MTAFDGAGAMLVLAAAVIAGVYAAGQLVRISAQPLVAEPFTGGLPPTEHAVSRYHVRWYTVTMLFLAFDMEMIMMYPFTLVISAMGPSSVIEMFTFLAALLAGVLYAWREGALRWA